MDNHSVVMSASDVKYGVLAEIWCNKRLPLQVLASTAGYYIGTCDEDGLPCSRESNEYFPTKSAAEMALAWGDWTQKQDL